MGKRPTWKLNPRATFTYKTEGPWSLHFHCVERGKVVQVHFTLEGGGLRAQRNYHGWKVYMDTYMADYRYCFMICWNFLRAHLQEVGLTQILVDRVNDIVFGWESRALTITWSRPLDHMWSDPYALPKWFIHIIDSHRRSGLSLWGPIKGLLYSQTKSLGCEILRALKIIQSPYRGKLRSNFVIDGPSSLV